MGKPSAIKKKVAQLKRNSNFQGLVLSLSPAALRKDHSVAFALSLLEQGAQNLQELRIFPFQPPEITLPNR